MYNICGVLNFEFHEYSQFSIEEIFLEKTKGLGVHYTSCILYYTTENITGYSHNII